MDGSVFSKLWSVFKLAWSERLAYRVNFFLEILSVILSTLIVIFLWLAVYRYARMETMGGYRLSDMVTYLLGAGLINTFILTTAENPETSQSILDGTLSTMLVKPISPYLVWFVRDLSGKSFLFFVGLLGYLVVFLFFREHLIFQTNGGYLLAFCAALLLASALQFLLFESFSLLSFWLENTYGIRFTLRVIMEVAGGAIIPLSFFPEVFRAIFAVLPFQCLIYFPMQIYLGKIPFWSICLGFAKVIVWISGLAFANFMLWRHGLRRYLAMGD